MNYTKRFFILDLKKKSPADGRVEEVSFTLELADHDYD